MIKVLDLHSQYIECRKDINAAIQHCLDNASFIIGKETAQFEEQMATYTGAEAVAACASGTTALQIALKACGIGPGDEVITVSYTFVASTEPITIVGATPVFCDIDEYNLIDIDHAESLITEKTKAILWVGLYGQTPDTDRLMALCKKYNLYGIEDAAQCFGYKYKNRRVGNSADITCHSFNPMKNLGGVGDSGMCSGRKELIDIARFYSNHGRNDKFVFEYAGYNARVDNIQAQVVLAKLPYLQRWLDRKHQIAQYYNSELADYYTIPKEHDWGQHTYYCYHMDHDERDRVRADLLNKGVETTTQYADPSHLCPAFAPWYRGALPVTENKAKKVFTIPINPHLTDAQVEYIANMCKQVA
jgi:dTDP-4-amino-4,6-dideoxygalactose transaminase